MAKKIQGGNPKRKNFHPRNTVDSTESSNVKSKNECPEKRKGCNYLGKKEPAQKMVPCVSINGV